MHAAPKQKVPFQKKIYLLSLIANWFLTNRLHAYYYQFFTWNGPFLKIWAEKDPRTLIAWDCWCPCWTLDVRQIKVGNFDVQTWPKCIVPPQNVPFQNKIYLSSLITNLFLTSRLHAHYYHFLTWNGPFLKILAENDPRLPHCLRLLMSMLNVWCSSNQCWQCRCSKLTKI